MSKLYDERFKEKIKAKILAGEFNEKQDLINYEMEIEELSS